ncbi:integrin alpha-PS3 isoform X1 [Drosophila biarmipes]|uniref:integrin alpha-PS3 isoform X1 n=2 Tax=Drosophila biarmipes TaxID=125945 RepID=UPI0021CC9B01|nr:integrin alpha-PS3 isoform X1 [Drosophila biarmipes]
MMSYILLLAFLALKWQTEAFNLSPHPNRVINFPKHLKTHLNQTRSSYFGFSLVIRPTSIFVGAPRAQSTLDSQRTIDETGAIFRCPLENGDCFPYALDSEGNVDRTYDIRILSSRHKDYQWLGGSMDGGPLDLDKLLVCAPRCYNPQERNGRMHGVCYWVPDTVSEQPSPRKVHTIWPLHRRDKQLSSDKTTYFYMGEVGLSAHVTDNTSRFLIGAPGIDNWRGGAILHQRKGNVRRRVMRDVGSEVYESVVLESGPWGERRDSYFGYAVSSGIFSIGNQTTVLYVATAPRANRNAGEAYIFDVSGKNMRKIHVFQGEQWGEYFGYSVVAEDVNGDGLADVVVSAPLNARGDSYDLGAIYVFINKGLFNFEKKIIRSPAGSKGRFGTTLSRLGDINHDGYNDLAVGAPFEGNGVVFIYLGSGQGLRDDPSQRLEAPAQQPSEYGSYMFGHGLSRGSDIDRNGFNDLAIGAPNAEAVYLYRTYPVVNIHATIKSESREIKPDQDKVKISACYRLATPSKAREVQQQELNIRVAIDKMLERVKFTENQNNEMSFKEMAGPREQCRVLEVKVRYSEKDLFKPIELEIFYELANKVPNSEEFCKTCAVVDPAEPKSYTEMISFITGCATNVCVPDLQLRSKDVVPSYTLGTTDTLRLSYEVINQGETAYLPQLNVTSSPGLPFAQVPGNCRVREEVMVCNLNGGRPLANGDSDSLAITFDVSQLGGDSLTIEAVVFSTGIDKNSTDNKQTNEIVLREFTEIDVSGGPTDGQVVLNKHPYSAEITNIYEVKSYGPSTIEELTMLLFVPIAFKMGGAVKPIFNLTSLKMQASYDSHLLPIKLYDENNTLLNEFPLEESPRDAENDDQITTSATRERRDLGGLALNQEVEIIEKDNLPINRTLVLSCRDLNKTICIRSEMRFRVKPEKPVNITISFLVDLSYILDPFEYFVILTELKLLKESDPESSSLVIRRNIQPNVIYKNLDGLPIWYIILAVIGGLLLFGLMTYGLRKLGFFKRLKRDDLKRLEEENNLNDDSPQDQDCEPEDIERDGHSENGQNV